MQEGPTACSAYSTCVEQGHTEGMAGCLKVHRFWHFLVPKFHRKRRWNNKDFSRHNELKIQGEYHPKAQGFFVKPWKVIVGDTILSIPTFLPFDRPTSLFQALAALPAPNSIAVRSTLMYWIQTWFFFDGKFLIESQRRWCFQIVSGRDFETKLRAAGSDLLCFFLWPIDCFSRCLCIGCELGLNTPYLLSGRLHHDLSEPVCVFIFNHKGKQPDFLKRFWKWDFYSFKLSTVLPTIKITRNSGFSAEDSCL